MNAGCIFLRDLENIPPHPLEKLPQILRVYFFFNVKVIKY